ncbi:MAG TPA: hypothetical protein VHK63_05370 [Candidatus Limnocylindria bacterium]|nr:hypothetical protein [Candidatus Limnocylindria bacterium]
MSTFFRVVVVLLVVGVVVGIGAGVYNAGVSAGLAEAAQATASGEPAPVGYHYGSGPYWHGFGGFGFFGIIFWILAILLIIGLVRAAFGWGRWGGPPEGPGGWRGRERIEAIHRELHRADGAEGQRPAGA